MRYYVVASVVHAENTSTADLLIVVLERPHDGIDIVCCDVARRFSIVDRVHWCQWRTRTIAHAEEPWPSTTWIEKWPLPSLVEPSMV